MQIQSQKGEQVQTETREEVKTETREEVKTEAERGRSGLQLGERASNFVSGLLAGVISVTLCNPLDMARTRLNLLNAPSHHRSRKYTHFSHALRTIHKQQGWAGFYSGYRTNIIAIPLFHSLFFPIYQHCKQQIAGAGHSKETACLGATVAAGAICNFVTNPIWIVRTRLMAQHLHPKMNQYDTASPFAVLREMYGREGITSLFKGVTASLFTVSNAVIYFGLYEQLKQLLAQGRRLTITNIFVSSTLAKITATVATYPITVVRTVMYDARGRHKENFTQIVRFILRENGVSGFYGGLVPDLIRLIPSNAITFIVYEKMKQFL